MCRCGTGVTDQRSLRRSLAEDGSINSVGGGRLVVELDLAPAPVHLAGLRPDKLADAGQDKKRDPDRRKQGKMHERSDEPEQCSDDRKLGW